MTATSTFKSALPPAAFALLACALLALAWRDVERVTGTEDAAMGDINDYAPFRAPGLEPAPDARPALAGLALFGEPASDDPQATPVAPPPVAADESALPESAAGYQLFGIIEADERERGRAILAGADGEQREYRVGDTMPDGAQVHAVRERAVLFERNGALERLALPAADAGDTGMANGNGMSPTPSLPNAAFPNMPGVPPRISIPGMNGRPSQLAPPMPVPPPEAVPAPIAEMPLESPPVNQ